MWVSPQNVTSTARPSRTSPYKKAPHFWHTPFRFLTPFSSIGNYTVYVCFSGIVFHVSRNASLMSEGPRVAWSENIALSIAAHSCGCSNRVYEPMNRNSGKRGHDWPRAQVRSEGRNEDSDSRVLSVSSALCSPKLAEVLFKGQER